LLKVMTLEVVADMSIIEDRPAIVLTRSDRDRLLGLIVGCTPSATIDFLRQELERAEVVSEQVSAAKMMVTIGTSVRFIDHASHRVSKGRLTFPNDIGTSHAISVLSPLGSALLGLGCGQTIDWHDDAGQGRRLTVVAMLPEAEG